MKVQKDHLLQSSFLLWVRNLVENRGQAYINGSGWFYDTQEVFDGRFSYSSPYQPFVSDRSISGATVMTGIYLDNTFITTGVSGLTGINYDKGTVYFISGITYPNRPAHVRLSGNFSISEFSYKLTNDPEEHLLFETKYSLKPKVGQTVTGIGPSEATFPVIYVKPDSSRSEEFAMGGTENVINTLRLIVLGDSQFQVEGVNSLVRDRVRSIVPLMTGAIEMPFNIYGGYSGPIYNYNNTFTGKFSTENSAFIEDIRVTRLVGAGMSELKKLNPHVFVSIIDVDLSTYRRTRI